MKAAGEDCGLSTTGCVLFRAMIQHSWRPGRHVTFPIGASGASAWHPLYAKISAASASPFLLFSPLHHRSVSSDPGVLPSTVGRSLRQFGESWELQILYGARPVDRSQSECNGYLVALRELGIPFGRYIPRRFGARRALKLGQTIACLHLLLPSGVS